MFAQCADPKALDGLAWMLCYLTSGTHRLFYLSFGTVLLVLAITGTVFVAEVIGGLLSGSLALLADAGHMLTDSTGLLLALLGASLATRAATARRTFGLQRAEVLAALANALLLVAISVWVLIQAVDRLRGAPTEIETGLMLGVAIGGAVANVIGLLLLVFILLQRVLTARRR